MCSYRPVPWFHRSVPWFHRPDVQLVTFHTCLYQAQTWLRRPCVQVLVCCVGIVHGARPISSPSDVLILTSLTSLNTDTLSGAPSDLGLTTGVLSPSQHTLFRQITDDEPLTTLEGNHRKITQHHDTWTTNSSHKFPLPVIYPCYKSRRTPPSVM